MERGERFLRVEDVSEGYCQICDEPKLVGRIAVAGWSFRGSVCSRCLNDLSTELQRRGSAVRAASGVNEKAPGHGVGGNANGVAAAAGSNGNGR